MPSQEFWKRAHLEVLRRCGVDIRERSFAAAALRLGLRLGWAFSRVVNAPRRLLEAVRHRVAPHDPRNVAFCCVAVHPRHGEDLGRYGWLLRTRVVVKLDGTPVLDAEVQRLPAAITGEGPVPHAPTFARPLVVAPPRLAAEGDPDVLVYLLGDWNGAGHAYVLSLPCSPSPSS